ncbi:MAG: 50S ribosomal protein L11 methyltransferase [Anaerolineaceae bacterium]|nr:50S ribosomal protein L11 methyltransferase [Anaerolineaceae bacterium]
MADTNWLEVSLTTSGELAEVVAETLAGYVANGVVVESGVRYDDVLGMGVAAGPVRVFGYIPIDDRLEATRQRLSEALWHLSCIQPLPEPVFRTIAEQNWMEAWKKHYHPIPVGQRLMVLPAWIEIDPAPRVAVRIDPSMAFGTGTHPTTRLCMEMIETWLEPQQPVIDLGCGSGILSISALLLGASQALAVDIDPEALLVARENASRNHVAERFETASGSLAEILRGDFSIRQAPLALVNILAPVILKLLDEGLVDLVIPGGVLALSGILEEQALEIETAACRLGMQLLEKRQEGDWVAFALRSPVTKRVPNRGSHTRGDQP